MIPAMSDALPATPDAGHRRRGDRHEDDGVAKTVRLELLQEFSPLLP